MDRFCVYVGSVALFCVKNSYITVAAITSDQLRMFIGDAQLKVGEWLMFSDLIPQSETCSLKLIIEFT
jgi:hypothetical protein